MMDGPCLAPGAKPRNHGICIDGKVQRSDPVTMESPSARAHAGGWGKALTIGVFAGVPTAIFHQVSFLQSLQKRGEVLRGWGPGSSIMTRGVPGLVPAVLRDVGYLAATQKQVQNGGSASTAEAALCWSLVVAAPVFFDTLSVKAVSPGYRRPQLTSLSGVGRFMRYGCPPEAFIGRLVWVPFYNLAYVTTQQQVGDSDTAHETAGLVLGSLTASLVAYPFFMFKYVPTPNHQSRCSPQHATPLCFRVRLMVKSVL